MINDEPSSNFDARRGEQARDEALERVEDNADDSWKNAALRAICITAAQHEEFISSDVWPNINSDAAPREARALGPMMVRAKKNGWIEATNQFKLATMVSRHRAPQRVWRSLIFTARQPE